MSFTPTDYYLADIRSLSDYYPFGMEMAVRSWNADGYRYGFNGKESDDEWQGDGNSYDYGFRIYNPMISKFLSVDPLADSFPWWTPYQFAGDKPIQAIDLDGLESVNYQSLLLPNGQKMVIDLNNAREVEYYESQIQKVKEQMGIPENNKSIEPFVAGNFSGDAFVEYWENHDYEVARMQYEFVRDWMPISGPLAQLQEAQLNYELGRGGKGPMFAAFFWFSVDLATMGEGSGPVKGATALGKKTKLFRFVGPDELADIFQSGLIRPGNGSMETKLFAQSF